MQVWFPKDFPKTMQIYYLVYTVTITSVCMIYIQCAKTNTGCPCAINTETEFVNCSFSKLKLIPTCIPNTTKTLLLFNNRLNNLSKAPFDRFRALQYLDLSINNLQFLSNDTFSGLSNLTFLKLSYNPLHLTDSFSKDTFLPLIALEELHIEGICDTNQHPKVDYIDTQLSRIPTLKRLYMDGLASRPLGHGFSALRSLEELYMNSYSGFCTLLILNSNTFDSLRNTSVKKLSFNGCHISFIYPNTFAGLRSMTVLNLDDNKSLCGQGLKNLTMGLNTTDSKVLIISNICRTRFFDISSGLLEGFAGTKLEYLEMKDDDIEVVDVQFFEMLPKSLKYLSLQNNKLIDVHFLTHCLVLSNLVTLDLSLQHRYELSQKEREGRFVNTVQSHVPGQYINLPIGELTKARESKQYDDDTKNNKVDSLNSHSTEVIYQENRLSGLRTVVNSSKIHIGTLVDSENRTNLNVTIYYVNLPFKLALLNISYNKLEFRIIPLNFNPNNSLQILDVSNNLHPSWIGPWKGLNRLEILNLTNNRLTLIHPFSFSYMPNLRILLLGQNRIGKNSMRNSTGRIFFNLTSLEILILDENGIKNLPKEIFIDLVNLKHLSLAGNSFTYLNFHVHSLVSLQTFNLSGNQIQFFPKQFMKELDRIAEFTHINLSLENNKLACDCTCMDFVSWLKFTRIHILNKRTISCQFRNGTFISLARIEYIPERLLAECMAWIVILSCVVGFFTLILVLGLVVVIYQKYWNLKYLLYMGRQSMNPYHPLEEQEIELKYDVYISYERDQLIGNNDTMHEFVTKTVYRHLYNRGLEVIIREELDIGKRQFDTISTTLRKCRKVVALITKDYCRDMWNLYEFNTAALEGIYTRRQVLIPVLLDSVNSKYLTADVFEFLKHQTVARYAFDTPERVLVDYLFDACAQTYN